MPSTLDFLPEPLARAVRLAFVPPETRALLAHIPGRLVLRGSVPARGALPRAALELLKAASLGEALDAEVTVGELALAIVHEGHARTLTPSELDGTVTSVLRAALPDLLPPAVWLAALETFASHAAKLAALRDLTAHMLRAQDVDLAVHAMLSGISSGYGLGFHRVALFTWDESKGAYTGTRAIGPADEAEAHRIWEAIEYESKELEGILSDYGRRDTVGRFEQAVRAIELRPTDLPGDEVTRALAEPGPHRLRGVGIVNRSLPLLEPAREFVLAAIRPRGEVRGLLFADDKYASAPLDEERIALLGGFLDPMALVWENLALLRRVEQLARHDALTGVLARRAFDERLAEEQARAARTGSAVGLMMIDLDHFKATNDTHGHAAGDAVLRSLGGILRADLRAHDLAGRLGGDEFAVLLPASGAAECAAVARRIGATAAAAGISLSIGIACFPDDCAAADRLGSVADERLYSAKSQGRGRVCAGDVTFEVGGERTR